MNEHRFPQGHNTFLDTRDRALDHDEVILDFTIVRETTEGSLCRVSKDNNQTRYAEGTNDSLLGNVEFGGGVTNVASLSDTVNLVVDRGAMMVTVLTSTSNSLLDY